MFADGSVHPEGCLSTNKDITDAPIAGAVGTGGANRAADVRTVQELLNSVPVVDGGPAVHLAEDGLCGPKTQAAINKFQAKVRPKPDGRIDPAGPTIKALTGLICDSVGIPAGRLGLAGKAKASAGTPNVAPAPNPDGEAIVAVALSTLRVLEPSLNLLRFKLTRTTPPMRGLLNKHFGGGGKDVTDGDIGHVQTILAGIHFFVARANAFGILPINNVILFDPVASTDTIGWTVRGGDKLSTKQFQIYFDKATNKNIKAPGQTVFLTNLFATNAPTFEKHWVVLHEMCHFVGARDGSAVAINDNGYAFEAKFGTLSKFQRLHNAESLSLFFLECCIGTAAVVALPRIQKFRTHFDSFPKVSPGGDIRAS